MHGTGVLGWFSCLYASIRLLVVNGDSQYSRAVLRASFEFTYCPRVVFVFASAVAEP